MVRSKTLICRFPLVPYINPIVIPLFTIFCRFQTGRRLTPSRHACVLVTYAKLDVHVQLYIVYAYDVISWRCK